MLHAKIIDSSIEKIEISKAEHFLKSEKFGAVIYFVGVVRDNNENKGSPQTF
jgi:molybdopterin synthase catalytic subunit